MGKQLLSDFLFSRQQESHATPQDEGDREEKKEDEEGHHLPKEGGNELW